MYSFPNLEQGYCSMSGSNSCFLICIQVSQETDNVVWYSHILKNFPVFVIHTVKSSQWSRSRCFSEFPSFLCDLMDVGNLISGSFAFSKSSLHIWKFSVYILLAPSLKDFEHYISSMWNYYNCTIVWTFFGIALLWDHNENWPFPVLWPLLHFPNLLRYWVH